MGWEKDGYKIISLEPDDYADNSNSYFFSSSRVSVFLKSGIRSEREDPTDFMRIALGGSPEPELSAD